MKKRQKKKMWKQGKTEVAYAYLNLEAVVLSKKELWLQEGKYYIKDNILYRF